jgi:lysophospholipase L1-like esterase
MKKLVAGLFVAFLVGGVLGAFAGRYGRSLIGGPGEPSYESDLSHRSTRSRQMRDAVVFFGDSQTARLGVSEFSAKAENFGISGNRIAWVQSSMPRYDLSKARAVVLAIGINDLDKREPQDFGERYAAVLRALPADIPVVTMAVFPVRPPFADGYVDARASIRALNQQIAQACRTRPNCVHMDLTAALADSDGYLAPRYSETDGVHISLAASLLWREELERLLISRLRQIDRAPQ